MVKPAETLAAKETLGSQIIFAFIDASREPTHLIVGPGAQLHPNLNFYLDNNTNDRYFKEEENARKKLLEARALTPAANVQLIDLSYTQSILNPTDFTVENTSGLQGNDKMIPFSLTRQDVDEKVIQPKFVFNQAISAKYLVQMRVGDRVTIKSSKEPLSFMRDVSGLRIVDEAQYLQAIKELLISRQLDPSLLKPEFQIGDIELPKKEEPDLVKKVEAAVQQTPEIPAVPESVALPQVTPETPIALPTSIPAQKPSVSAELEGRKVDVPEPMTIETVISVPAVDNPKEPSVDLKVPASETITKAPETDPHHFPVRYRLKFYGKAPQDIGTSTYDYKYFLLTKNGLKETEGVPLLSPQDEKSIFVGPNAMFRGIPSYYSNGRAMDGRIELHIDDSRSINSLLFYPILANEWTGEAYEYAEISHKISQGKVNFVEGSQDELQGEIDISEEYQSDLFWTGWDLLKKLDSTRAGSTSVECLSILLTEQSKQLLDRKLSFSLMLKKAEYDELRKKHMYPPQAITWMLSQVVFPESTGQFSMSQHAKKVSGFYPQLAPLNYFSSSDRSTFSYEGDVALSELAKRMITTIEAHRGEPLSEVKQAIDAVRTES